MNKLKKIIKNNLPYIITLIISTCLFFIELPYYIMAPGGTINIGKRMISDENINLNGNINMLYASSIKATIPTCIIAKINDKWDIFKNEERQISNESIKEIELRDKILLTNSINNAIYVAYTTSGKELKIKDIKNYVIGKVEESKCDLNIGDLVTKIDNQNINEINMNEYIKTLSIGDIVNFEIINNNNTQNKTCEVININNENKIGIVYSQNIEYDESDINIKFKASESGSSGGFMMALAMYLNLSEEDLLKGRNIAGTGTIDIYGNVGEIGGVKYKIIGAHKNNIDTVFVPTANYEEAIKVKEKYNYDINIISVTNINDAINYLKNN